MNELYDLLKNLPEDLEHLNVNFYWCKTFTDIGFQSVAKALTNSKQLKILMLSTFGTDKKKCTQKHIDMISEVLKVLNELQYFIFEHEKFENTKKMEEILVKKLGMKAISGNNKI